MKKFIRNILPLAVMVVMAAPMMMSSDKDTPTVTDADRRKAEYYFLEAQNEKSREQEDAYYDLIERAHQLNPTNSTYSFYLGFAILSMPNITRTQANRALELMKEHYEACPNDMYETTFYSDACMMLGNPGDGLKAIKTLSDRNPYRIELQSRLADAYARVGDFASSTAVYDSIEAIHGKNLPITSKKLSNYVALKDTLGAINEMRALLATAPRNAEYNITMGSIMQQFGMPDSAIHYLDLAQQAEPDNGYTYLAKAQYYMLNGDSAQYERQLHQALINENLDIEDKMQLLVSSVKDMIQSRDSSGRADTLFTVLIRQHPHEAGVHEMYSEYLMYKQDYKQAAEQLQYMLDLNPTDADGWRQLMVVQMMNEDFQSAIKTADKALEYNPDSQALYLYIASSYYQMKQYDKALETYNTALAKADSTEVMTLSDIKGGMGDVYHELGQNEMAYKYYEESIELNPSNVGIMNNYAYFLSLDGKDLDKAERMAGLAVKSSPNSATYLDTYAWIYFKKKDYTMALLYIRRAIDNDDTHSGEVYEHYGDILFMSGEVEQAIEQWKIALEKDPDNKLLEKKINQKTYLEE
ncbi:MAG: tetratricopeptide repeat protein [Muribaculaceae bacterium]|nr:tetratricopeptide repeat protein [Muribaculaceae bacterium]